MLPYGTNLRNRTSPKLLNLKCVKNEGRHLKISKPVKQATHFEQKMFHQILIRHLWRLNMCFMYAIMITYVVNLPKLCL